jgi:hypothetical protein
MIMVVAALEFSPPAKLRIGGGAAVRARKRKRIPVELVFPQIEQLIVGQRHDRHKAVASNQTHPERRLAGRGPAGCFEGRTVFE